jgi:hypothetical protein
MIDMQNTLGVAGWMISAKYALEIIAMQNAKAKAEPYVSGIFGRTDGRQAHIICGWSGGESRGAI